MKLFGESVEEYIIHCGIVTHKIHLKWIESDVSSNSEENTSEYEIFVTADTTFTFTE